jgi:dGTP triphosphohydrolase
MTSTAVCVPASSTLEQLTALSVPRGAAAAHQEGAPELKAQLQGSELVPRDDIGRLVPTSSPRARRRSPRRAAQHRRRARMPQGLIESSDPLREERLQLKQFLRDALYMHPRVQQMTAQARDTVRLLFESLTADYGRMPTSMRRTPRSAPRRRRTRGRSRRGRLHRRHDGPVRMQTRDSLRADRTGC